MRSAWLIGVNSLSGRKRRTALLAGAVALSTALIVAVACAIASVNAGLALRAARTIGLADLHVRHVGDRLFGSEVLGAVRAWPEVAMAAGRSRAALPLSRLGGGEPTVAIGWGVEPGLDERVHPQEYGSGRPVMEQSEIALEERLAELLGVAVGEVVRAETFYGSRDLRVVGITRRPLFGNVARPEAFVAAPVLGALSGYPDRLSAVDIVLRPGREPDATAEAHAKDVPSGLAILPTERVTSRLDRNMRAGNIGFTLAACLTFLAASFIILTGLTTGVLERQRELAIMRAVGARRWQAGAAQLVVGAIIGGAGALVGVPLGVAIALVASIIFREHLPAGFRVSMLGLALGGFGAVGAGLLGATWSAVSAGRVSPLAAMRPRAAPARARGVWLTAGVGAALIAMEFALAAGLSDAQANFWAVNLAGVPAMFTGWFLLGAGVTLGVSAVAAPALSRLLGVPRRMLSGAVRASPYRFGFTAGSLMVGLSLMVSLWTNGAALLRDWLGRVKFPDAFISAPAGITPQDQARIEALPSIEGTCAITLQRLNQSVFGVRALQRVKTSFLAFEPRPFFDMVTLEWVEGEPEAALPRLEAGGAVIVAREFRTAQGLGVGDSVTLEHEGREHTF